VKDEYYNIATDLLRNIVRMRILLLS